MNLNHSASSLRCAAGMTCSFRSMICIPGEHVCTTGPTKCHIWGTTRPMSANEKFPRCRQRGSNVASSPCAGRVADVRSHQRPIKTSMGVLRRLEEKEKPRAAITGVYAAFA